MLKRIPWSGSKWCYLFEYTDRSTITRLRTEPEADAVFMPSSHALFQTRVSVLSYWVYWWRCMGGSLRQDRTTPDHGIRISLDCRVSIVNLILPPLLKSKLRTSFRNSLDKSLSKRNTFTILASFSEASQFRILLSRI